MLAQIDDTVPMKQIGHFLTQCLKILHKRDLCIYDLCIAILLVFPPKMLANTTMNNISPLCKYKFKLIGNENHYMNFFHIKPGYKHNSILKSHQERIRTASNQSPQKKNSLIYRKHQNCLTMGKKICVYNEQQGVWKKKSANSDFPRNPAYTHLHPSIFVHHWRSKQMNVERFRDYITDDSKKQLCAHHKL